MSASSQAESSPLDPLLFLLPKRMIQLYPCQLNIAEENEIHKEKTRFRYQNLKTTQLYLMRGSDSEVHSLDGHPSWEIIQTQISNFGSPLDGRYHLEVYRLMLSNRNSLPQIPF